MRKHFMNAVLLLTLTAAVYSCQKKTETAKEEVSQEVLNQIRSMGFNNEGVIAENGGYLVEGDIFIPVSELGKNANSPSLVVASEEQYRTTNLVTVSGGSRTINISTNATASYFITAIDEAIARYNAENLTLKFNRITSGTGDINIVTFYEVSNTLGSGGFPSGGNPYNQIRLNTYWYTSSTNTNYLATIIAHEIGHCIGFRHTDYMNRAYSCGGRKYNEGTAGVGAVWIPGTPTSADPNSWMLACIGSGVNRPFNANDKVALGYLY